MPLSRYLKKGMYFAFMNENFELAESCYFTGISNGYFDCVLGLFYLSAYSPGDHACDYDFYRLMKIARRYGLLDHLCSLARIDPDALFWLGFTSLWGLIGVKVDVKTGLKTIKDAAKKGSVAAIVSLVLCYHNGMWDGAIPVNMRTALKYLKKGAKLRSSSCIRNIACMYSEENKNVEKSLELALDACAYGNPRAFYTVATTHFERGEMINLEYAFKLSSLSSELMKTCLERAANRYVQFAVKLSLISSEMGHANASVRMAIYYSSGRYVETNYKKAYFYASKAFCQRSVVKPGQLRKVRDACKDHLSQTELDDLNYKLISVTSHRVFNQNVTCTVRTPDEHVFGKWAGKVKCV